jgi:hypothetical protein
VQNQWKLVPTVLWTGFVFIAVKLNLLHARGGNFSLLWFRDLLGHVIAGSVLVFCSCMRKCFLEFYCGNDKRSDITWCVIDYTKQGTTANITGFLCHQSRYVIVRRGYMRVFFLQWNQFYMFHLCLMYSDGTYCTESMCSSYIPSP